MDQSHLVGTLLFGWLSVGCYLSTLDLVDGYLTKD